MPAFPAFRLLVDGDTYRKRSQDSLLFPRNFLQAALARFGKKEKCNDRRQQARDQDGQAESMGAGLTKQIGFKREPRQAAETVGNHEGTAGRCPGYGRKKLGPVDKEIDARHRRTGSGAHHGHGQSDKPATLKKHQRRTRR